MPLHVSAQFPTQWPPQRHILADAPTLHNAHEARSKPNTCSQRKHKVSSRRSFLKSGAPVRRLSCIGPRPRASGVGAALAAPRRPAVIHVRAATASRTGAAVGTATPGTAAPAPWCARGQRSSSLAQYHTPAHAAGSPRHPRTTPTNGSRRWLSSLFFAVRGQACSQPIITKRGEAPLSPTSRLERS